MLIDNGLMIIFVTQKLIKIFYYSSAASASAFSEIWFYVLKVVMYNIQCQQAFEHKTVLAIHEMPMKTELYKHHMK